MKLAKKFIKPTDDVNNIEQKDIKGKTGDNGDNKPNITLDGKVQGDKKKKKCCWVYNYLVISDCLIIILKNI